MAELRNIDLNLLVIFQRLLQERSISAVARQLDLSQPAVSNALRRLRAACGDDLFVRTAQGMQPTPHAERLGGPVARRWRCCRMRWTPPRTSSRGPAHGAFASPCRMSGKFISCRA